MKYEAKAMSLLNDSWSRVREALEEVEERRRVGQIPFTCFYRRKGILIGSYFCGDDEEGEFVLFINKDYSDPALLVDLISQHCQFLNDEVGVYTLDARSTKLYGTVNPKNSISVEL